MIVALHAALGAATGAGSSSRVAAIALGPPFHVASDRVPHRHPAHDLTEYAAGLAVLAAVARARGIFDPATLGALAAVAPDVEHLVPRRLRPRGAKLFHRRPERRGARTRGISAPAQMLLAGAIVSLVVRRR